jgi:hypothetical protein
MQHSCTPHFTSHRLQILSTISDSAHPDTLPTCSRSSSSSTSSSSFEAPLCSPVVRATALEGYVRICFAQYLLLLEKQRKLTADPNQKSGSRPSAPHCPMHLLRPLSWLFSTASVSILQSPVRTPDQHSSPFIPTCPPPSLPLLLSSYNFPSLLPPGFLKNSEVSSFIASAVEAAMLVANTDPHRATRRRAATTLLHAIQVCDVMQAHLLCGVYWH